MAQARYQLWWTDDLGNKLLRLDKFDTFFLNYARIVNGQGVCNVGIPLDESGYIFRKDYHIEVWRSPAPNIKFQLEGVFFAQKAKVYTRVDEVTVLELSAQHPNMLLDRRIVAYKSGTSQSQKTDNLDDMMKAIVRENLGSLAVDSDRDYTIIGQFQVQADTSLGASVTKGFSFRNVLTVLKELSEASKIDTPKIFFEVVPLTPTLFEFQTFQNQVGGDRRFAVGGNDMLFSIERGNLGLPFWEVEHFGEKNTAFAAGSGTGADRLLEEVGNSDLQNASAWARAESYRDARSQDTVAGLTLAGQEELSESPPKKRFVANLISKPGSEYGIDWSFGDKVTANYAEQQFDVDVKIVYVSVDEDGAEVIQGRTEFGSFQQ